jgi:hypothetical protein
MSEADEGDARIARARQLREQIEGLHRPSGAGEGQPLPSPASPRDFTDAAAAREAEHADQESARDEADVAGAQDESGQVRD